ncbi:MAG TPA: hypothetical protein VK175_20120 [Leadbetterella sp.]|nr:hypothetical protein [Leadbetterella sp.]
MKKYTITKMSTMWSTNNLKTRVERFLDDASANNHKIVSVSFGVNLWWMPTAYITLEMETN